MKDRLKKQRQRLFIKIMSAMFLLSLIVFATISLNILSNEKQRLESETFTEFAQISDNVPYMMEGGISLTANDVLNVGNSKDRAHVRVSDVTDTDDRNKNIVAETWNAISVSFYDKEKITWFGSVDFDQFRNTLTDKQYKTICDYISKDADENGEYYMLVCTKFYYRENEILPKTIEIVRTKEENDWYVQDTVVEHYELNPTTQFGDVLYESPGDMRNVLTKDFVFGEYEVERYIDKVDEFFETFDSDEYYATHTKGPFPLRTGLFTYLVYYTDYTTGYQKLYLEDLSDVDAFDMTGELVDVDLYGVAQPYAYDVRYANEINILNGCLSTILMMFIYIFVLFSIVGVVIGAISWNALKKQIEQEQKLRTVTNAMAHELKTPLFIIGGYCDNLMENINKEKHEHYAYVISQQTQDMNELVVKMLEYSKLDSANFRPKMELFSISKLTRDLVVNYDFYDIEFECDKEFNIKADKKLIICVIENLIDNAIKYTTDVDRIKVSIKNGKFSISNPCSELSKTDIDNMWQPYHRNADNSDKEGFGLGLAIVKSVFEMHNIKYRAEYADGQITFEFNLPK